MNEINDKPCRHEYVKIFQRKYKNYERRLVSTRGFLPTGFSNKDFSFLNQGTYCFCSKCRKCLYPVKSQKASNTGVQQIAILAAAPVENTWGEEAETESKTNVSHKIEVEELQVEATDVTDIVDKEIVRHDEAIEQESEEE